MSIHKPLLTVAALAITILLALMLSDRRVLVYEHKVSPGKTYVIPEHGNLGDAQGASLHCKYFTGRALVDTVFWYSPNNVMGKDSCPFITKP
jgi:hypothetical protein